MGSTLKRTLFVVLIGVLATLYACATGWPWDADMSRQPAPAPYSGPRSPVKGTLPSHGEFPLDRSQLEALYPTNPLPTSESVVEGGKQLFSVYCSPCHGPQGKGDGPVAAKFIPPTDLASPFIQENGDGWFYGTIRNGVRLMPRYGVELTPDQRWHIVTFLRTLK